MDSEDSKEATARAELAEEQAMGEDRTAEEAAKFARDRIRARRELAAVFSKPPLYTFGKPEPITELSPEQAVRMLAVQMSADVLAKTGKPAVMAGRVPIKSMEIITLAEYVLSGLGEEEVPKPDGDLKGLLEALSGPAIQEERDDVKRRLAREAGADLTSGLAGLFGAISDAVGIPNERIPVQELRVGDQIAPDGDRLVEVPVYDLEQDVWIGRAHCPKDNEGETFEVRIKNDGEPVPVFERGPE